MEYKLEVAVAEPRSHAASQPGRLPGPGIGLSGHRLQRRHLQLGAHHARQRGRAALTQPERPGAGGELTMSGKVAVITGARTASAPAWSPGTADAAGRWWPARARSPWPRIRICSPCRGHRRTGDRRPDHRRGAGPVRAHRHPGQQRGRVHRQAVHRLHPGRLRHRHRGQPHRVLLGDPTGRRRDGDPVRRPRGQRLGHPGRGRGLRRPRGAGRADQGRPGCGDQVAGHRVRLPGYPGQRRLAGIIQTPGHPSDSHDCLGGRLPPLGRPCQVSDVVDGVLFLESSPYITGEILHVDGGQIASH